MTVSIPFSVADIPSPFSHPPLTIPACSPRLFDTSGAGVGPLTDGSHLTVDLNLRAKSLHEDDQRYISKAQFNVLSYNMWGRLDDQANLNRIFETNEFGETKPHLQYLKRIEELLNTTPDLPGNFELPDPVIIFCLNISSLLTKQ